MARKTRILRYCRFRLASLFWLVAFCAIAFSWIDFRLREAREQRVIVASLTRQGVEVFYDYEYIDGYGRVIGAIPTVPNLLMRVCGRDFFYRPACFLIAESAKHTDEIISETFPVAVIEYDGFLPDDV